jgi:hypothetical protein
MQKIYHAIRNLMLLAMVLCTLASCKKSFLEITPKGRVIATKTTDYDLLLNNLDLINYSCDSHVLMGDEAAAAEPGWAAATFREKQLVKWEGDLYNIDEDAKETLVPVKSLYIYNKVINEVMNSTEGAETTKKSLQAEALAGRAWCNFLLINFYGKPYNPATAETDPGFPLITQADINAHDFKRATVQEIYNQIISDLTTAIPNLINDGVPHRIRMSKATAQGLLAKVYIFMGKHAEALPLLNESINNVPKSLVVTSVVNFNTAFPNFPTVVNDQENMYAKGLTNTYTYTSNRLIWLTPEAAKLYNAADVRLSKWYTTGIFGTQTLYRRTGSLTSSIGLRVPELYLLRAEVKARLDDLSGAVSDVKYLRDNRMPASVAVVPAASASARLPLLQFIFEERIREFALQGYRWFDMRRLSVDPLFATTTTPVHRIYNAAGIISESYTLKPERFVFRFSPKVLAENSNLQNNP